MNNKWKELFDAAKQVLKPRDVSRIIETGVEVETMHCLLEFDKQYRLYFIDFLFSIWYSVFVVLPPGRMTVRKAPASTSLGL